MEFVRITPDEVAGVRDDIHSVYCGTFALSPYNEGEKEFAAFEDKLKRHSARDGFRLCVARERTEIVGFSYGFASGENRWTRSLIEPLLTENEVEVWLTDCFEFVELAVLPEARGRGIGERLHDELISGLPHRTAALFVMEEAGTALRLYRKRGWRTLVEDFSFPGAEGSGNRMSVMALDLDSRNS